MVIKLSMFLFLTWCWTSQVALVVKNLAVSAGDLRDTGSNPGRPMDGGAWQAATIVSQSRHD